MSITIGKRSFNDTVSELSHERFLHYQADFRRSKNNVSSNESNFDHLQANKEKNIMKLEALFPKKTKNVLIFLLVFLIILKKQIGINAINGRL